MPHSVSLASRFLASSSALEIERVAGFPGRRHFLDPAHVLGLQESIGRRHHPLGRVLVVIAVVPAGILADRFGGDAALNPVAAADLDRLAGDRNEAVHQVGIHVSPHPGVHPAHGRAHDEAQVLDAETFGHELVLGRDDVLIAVMGELGAQAVARLAGAAAADTVRQDDEVLRRVERLAGGEQLVGKRGHQPGLAAGARAVEQDHRIGDVAGRVALRRSQRRVMLLEVGMHLAALEAEILDDEIGLALVRPVAGGVPGVCGPSCAKAAGAARRRNAADNARMLMDVLRALPADRGGRGAPEATPLPGRPASAARAAFGPRAWRTCEARNDRSGNDRSENDRSVKARWNEALPWSAAVLERVSGPAPARPRGRETPLLPVVLLRLAVRRLALRHHGGAEPRGLPSRSTDSSAISPIRSSAIRFRRAAESLTVVLPTFVTTSPDFRPALAAADPVSTLTTTAPTGIAAVDTGILSSWKTLGVGSSMVIPSEPRLDLAELQDLVGDGPRHVDGNRKSHAGIGVARADERGVDADQVTVKIDQRAAGIAGINRRIGLDEILVLLEPDIGAAQPADDPGGHGLADIAAG